MPDALNTPRPVVLCILDGWGHRVETWNNAIALANTPVWDRLLATCPQALAAASEHHVGLPNGQMGNSEVGHMNIGAGRVILQDLPKIDDAVKGGALSTRPQFAAFVDKMQASGGTAHVLGLLSPGGIHSHQDHFAAVVQCLSEASIPVSIHAFLDGRDTPPQSADGYVRSFEASIPDCENVRIGTITGRYFAMDRDKRWDRVARAYEALVGNKGESARSATEAIAKAWARNETDEFVSPTIVDGYTGMHDGDGVFMVNFRADRSREILTALLDPVFDGFDRPQRVSFAAALGMTEYSGDHNHWMEALFPSEMPPDVLGAVVANAGLRQLRIAETEKYAHVTFFLNGGREAPFPGEERILVPSPKVATYDLQPEMSAPALTDRLVDAVRGGAFDLIVVNYANADMVGHTGNLAAAIKAVETVDNCLGRLETAILRAGGAMIVTADHGNVEQMVCPDTRQAHTAHTRNLVPIVLIGDVAHGRTLKNGCLADLAPTVLDLMQIERPAAMTGLSLLTQAEAVASAPAETAAA